MAQTTSHIMDWFDNALAAGNILAAERIANTFEPDCERVYALLKIVEQYNARGETDKAKMRAAQAVTIWRMNSDQWWQIPMLGDLLRRLVNSGQLALAGELFTSFTYLPETTSSTWLQTLAMCGLAQGAFWLQKQTEARDWFDRAAAVANNRATEEQRASSKADVANALRAIGWGHLLDEILP